MSGSEPDLSIAELCLVGLGITGGEATVPRIRFELENELTSHQIRGGLTTLAGRKVPAAVEVVRGRRGHGRPSVWRVTDAGRAWLSEWCGPDSPLRVPCGLGWPG